MQEEVRLGCYGLGFSRGTHSILEEVTFELRAGEFMALLGPNGSGKSTLLQCLGGLLVHSGGKQSGLIRHRKDDVHRLSFAERARRITYLGPEIRSDFPLRVQDYVLLGRLCHGSGRFGRFGEADLEATLKALNDCRALGLKNRELGELSSGERQRVSMARALAQGAQVLLLDEGLSQMDLNHQAAMGSLLRSLCREQGYSVILVAHDLNVATEWADTALLLRGGRKIALGPIEQVVTPERLREIYPEFQWLVSPSPASKKPKVFFS